MKSSLLFRDGKVEHFTDKEQFTKRMEQLNSQNVEFNFQINSCLGREYFQDQGDFYTRLSKLRRNKIKPLPLIRTSQCGWVKTNIYKQLLQLNKNASANL